jgi:hypothetical protein
MDDLRWPKIGEHQIDDLRGAKLIASAILTAAGALSMSLAHPTQALGFFLGLVLLVIGIPLMVIQWRGPKRQAPREPLEPLESNGETGFKETMNY